MPYIKVENGVMQEYNNDGLNTGPVASIGLNAYSYLERRAWSATGRGGTGPDNPDYVDDFPFLQSKGIKYLQVMVAPYASKDSTLPWGKVVGEPAFSGNLVSNLNINDSYWATVQTFLDSARSHNIGIIACPFWNIKAIPQLVGENNSALLQSDSKTRNYIRAFTAAFVARYKNHQGIAAWMAGQEITLKTGIDFNTAPAILKEIAEIIRAQDDLKRMISSGNAALTHVSPRQYTIDQYADIVLAMNPSPIDTLCENLFLKSEYFSTGESPADVLGTGMEANFTSCSLPYLKVMQKLAKESGKPYYVGSFGLTKPEEEALQDNTQHNLSTLLQNFYRTGVQLACHWVWNSGNIGDLDKWKVLVSDTHPSENKRAEVFAAITAVLDRSRTAPPDNVIDRKLNSTRFTRCATFKNAPNKSCLFTITPKTTLCPGTDFSISFTIKQDDQSVVTPGPLFRRFSGAANVDARGWVVYKTSANLYSQVFALDSLVNDSSKAGDDGRTNVAGKWTRITFTVNANSRIALYVNDFLMSYTYKSLQWSNVDGKLAIQVGRDSYSSSTVTWQLSDIILYDRVLTPQEVFDYGVTGQVVNAAGRWNLNGDLKDSINNNDGVSPGGTNVISFDSTL
ncbi:LamG-like jellyroll fold domain-containing protein [Rugamonas aquatica]|uniref:DUF4038 domain-containing protein n=1 Tax=Rugamonas aquatica TaxID=2743357 RepID=A0A6A7MUD2_9BURK|nr:DUF4038 domain-containing protein [Rugamonas aquatica]MQA36722.1 DUF4038 domain-containing protein [Rugamonas aquatica]